jgi:hypothetical protein
LDFIPEFANSRASADGRTPFEVYWDVRFLGNSRLAPCSRILKQVPARRWLSAHCDPASTTVYVGIDAGETRRIAGIRLGWSPWTVEFPLTALTDQLSSCVGRLPSVLCGL